MENKGLIKVLIELGMTEREAEKELRKVKDTYQVPKATYFLGYDNPNTMFS